MSTQRTTNRRTDLRSLDDHYSREDVLRLLECEPGDDLGEPAEQHRTDIDEFLDDRLTAREQLLLEAGLDPAEERREAVA
jgi:hypothetical protein